MPCWKASQSVARQLTHFHAHHVFNIMCPPSFWSTPASSSITVLSKPLWCFSWPKLLRRDPVFFHAHILICPFFFSWSTLFEEFFWHHENAVVISHCFLVCRGRNFLLVFFHKLSRLIFFVKAAKPFVFSCHIHSYAPFTIHIASVSCDCFLYYKFSSL